MRFSSFLSCFTMTLCLFVAGFRPLAQAQQFDLLLKGGRLIDPRNRIDSVMDIAISGGKIARVGQDIPADQGKQVVNTAGLIVAPGLIDIHVHVFYGIEPDGSYSSGPNGLAPDGFTFRSGVTTAVDVGSAGWKNFREFKARVIDSARTRILAFLNIVGSGMKGDPVEQNLVDMDAKLTATRVKQFPEILVGVKVAHYRGSEWEPVDRAVEAGRLANVPVMVDFGAVVPELSLKELLLTHLRPSDILTHTYAHVPGRIPIVDEQANVRPYVLEARKRGIIFDVGHGGASFVYGQAIPALKQGFVPDSISTDLHRGSMNAGMKDMINVMSKFLNMGMSLGDVILRSTWNPAQEIKRTDLGHLSVGARADVAVLRLREGNYGFVDVTGGRMLANRKLECELTLRDGNVVWDLNGISYPEWNKMPAN